MKNDSVIESWLNSTPATSSKKPLSTNGFSLFSYSLEIARYRWSDDCPIVFDYTSKSRHFQSATTSKHIGMTIRMLREKNIEFKIINPGDEHA